MCAGACVDPVHTPAMTALRQRGTLATCAALLAWSLIPLALLLLQVLRDGGVLGGGDGMLAGSDQQLYMTFIREAGTDVLISNEYRLGDSEGVFLHPMWLISGGLYALGIDVRVALLLWKPVAAVVLGAGVWLFAGRFLAERARVAATALGLFFFSPVLPALLAADVDLSDFDHLVFFFTSGESMAALQLWGYLHAALTIGLMALFLLGVERIVAPEHRAEGRGAGWYVAWTAAAGSVIGWLLPWKGETLLAILGALALWGRLAPRYRVLVVPAAAIVIPMAYLALLPRIDFDWEVYAPNNEAAHAPWWILLAALLPLAVPALAGLRTPRDDADRILLLWPPAGLLVYFLTTQFPYHALQGLAIPLAILAVEGWRRTSLPAWTAVVCVAVLTLPGVALVLDQFRDSRGAGVAPYVLRTEENDALRFLADSPRDGGVLARYYLGMTVPPRTGRDTWLGQFPWTPDFEQRRAEAEELFSGRLTAADAQAMVRRIRPAWLLTDCDRQVDLAPLLGDLVTRRHRFGCASVYEVGG